MRLIFTCRLSLALLLMCSQVRCISNAECSRMFNTQAQSLYVCGNHTDLVPALESAERIAREQCEKDFSKDRWNCSGFSLLKAPNISDTSKQYVVAVVCGRVEHCRLSMCTKSRSATWKNCCGQVTNLCTESIKSIKIVQMQRNLYVQ